MKKIKAVFCCIVAITSIIFLSGCYLNNEDSQLIEQIVPANEDVQAIEHTGHVIEGIYPPVEDLNNEHTVTDTRIHAYQYKQVLSLTLGADRVYTKGVIVKIPDGVAPDDIYAVNVKHMGDIDSVIALDIWDSVEEAEKLLFGSIFDAPIYLVLEVKNLDGDIIGYSLTSSRIDNAITHECYTAEIEEIVWHMFWDYANANPCGCWGIYCVDGCIVTDSDILGY